MNNRIKFFLSHLCISVLVALIVICVVFVLWYPSPLAKAAGVTHIFLMLLVIDVILGPLLGLLVYKEGKKTLKMDLTVIILIQIAALSYGLYSIAQARPVWIAFNNDRFELVRNNELKTENITHAQPQYQQPTWLQPQYVAVKQAADPQEQQIEQMRIKAHDLPELNQWNAKVAVQQVLKVYPEANAWLPLETYGLAMVILVNKETAEVIKIVDLRPWN